MKSATAKVLHPIAGVPTIGDVLLCGRRSSPAHTVAVVRHERDSVAAAIAELSDGVIIVDQDDVPGTGRAVELAIAGRSPILTATSLLVSGDVPLPRCWNPDRPH